MYLSIGVLDEDDIGPEIISSAVWVLGATELALGFVELPVRLTAYEEYGLSVQNVTLERLETVNR